MTVVEIQEALIAAGYDLGPAGADGDASPRTIAAVTAFQRVSGLVADGIAGPITRTALASPAVIRKATSREPSWLTLARGDIGIVEGIGESNNPAVIRYFADAGFAGVKDDAVAWCAAFVGAELQRAGLNPSGSLAARSYEQWGVGLAIPALGCIGTKKRNNSSWQGHVGFVVGASSAKIFLLGGNQDDRVSIAGFTRSEFTAFRWPAGTPLPEPAALPTTVSQAKLGVRES